jgi:hypothetical protein
MKTKLLLTALALTLSAAPLRAETPPSELEKVKAELAALKAEHARYQTEACKVIDDLRAQLRLAALVNQQWAAYSARLVSSGDHINPGPITGNPPPAIASPPRDDSGPIVPISTGPVIYRQGAGGYFHADDGSTIRVQSTAGGRIQIEQ